MTSSIPVVRQIAWLSALPQLAILLLLILVARVIGAGSPIVVGAVAYLATSFGLRFGIAKDHRRGIRLFHKERFAEAVPHFLRSHEFFSRHKWLDDWRAVTMLSSSRISYREMALLNAAFCLGQSGERQRAAEEYMRVLLEFPRSRMAEAALRLMGPQAASGQQTPAADAGNPHS